jgi:single-strand DNA-binding protein
MDGMYNLNKVILIGRLTHAPKLSYTPTGKPVTRFNLAVNTKYGKSVNNLFVDVVVWNKLAENCEQYLTKGKGVYVEGSLVMRKWKSDDKFVTKLEVVGEHIKFLSSMGADDKKDDLNENDLSENENIQEEDDRVPF